MQLVSYIASYTSQAHHLKGLQLAFMPLQYCPCFTPIKQLGRHHSIKESHFSCLLQFSSLLQLPPFSLLQPPLLHAAPILCSIICSVQIILHCFQERSLYNQLILQSPGTGSNRELTPLMSYGAPGLKDVATAFRLSQRYRTSILQTCLSHAGIREPLTKVPNVYLRCAFYRIEGALSIECAPIYRLSRIVGIPRLRCAFYRLRKSIESAEHIYQHGSPPLAGFSAMVRHRRRFGKIALMPVFYRKHL